MECLPRIKISIEELFYVKENLQKIYSKMQDKLIKDQMNRNTDTKKSLQEFYKIYLESHPSI